MEKAIRHPRPSGAASKNVAAAVGAADTSPGPRRPGTLVAMNLRQRIGLQDRAIALCVFLLLSAAGALGTALIWQNHRSALRGVNERAEIHARSIAHTAEAAVLLADRAALERLVVSASQDSSVARALILGSDGGVMAEFRRPMVPARALDPTLLGPAGGERVAPLLRRERESLYVVAPVRRVSEEIDLGMVESAPQDPERPADVLGYVCLIYDLRPILAELTGRVLSGALIASFVVAVGVALTTLAMRQLLRPLAELHHTAAAIAAGDRSKRAGECALGEIGLLARSFNHMADHLQASYDSVEQKVIERTAQLEAQRKELERAKFAAEAANRAKSDFLANMSHEIRTPLTAMLGFAENLLDAALSPRERDEAIRTIRRSSDHLLQIVNDVLDISRIEAGAVVVEKVSCPIVQVLSELESLMRPRATAKGLEFAIVTTGRLPESIHSDPTRLRQILLNLVGNAIKFTDSGSVEVHVQILAPDGDAPTLRVDVCDSGIGMTPEQLGRLFRPFTQADETMTRRFGGTGLGLVISRRLAEILGGSIRVESELGRGSRFTLEIPTGPLEGAEWVRVTRGALCPKATPEQPAVTEPLGCRVLLVEDGPDNQRLISFVLTKAGAEVSCAADGQSGVDLANRAIAAGRPFDLILMDMQMPVLDGYRATRMLREQGYDRPIIALTAHAMAGDRDRCLSAGCDAYSTKPIDRHQLVEMVRRYARAGCRDAAATGR